MADLITLEDYKLFLKRSYKNSSIENEHDIYFSNILLPGASEAMRAFFGTDFQSIARTETFSVTEPETKRLFPRYKPISSITSLTIDGVSQGSDTYKLLTDTNSIVLSSAISTLGALVESYYWPQGYNHIVLNYVGGKELSRVHKMAICSFIAKIDKQFSSVIDADAEIREELSALENGVFFNMFQDVSV